MMNFAKLATAALSISALALVATSADAQSRRNRDRAAAETPATPPVSQAFSTAYVPIQPLLAAANWAGADALLPAIKAAAASEYERYLAARADLSIALGLNDVPRQVAAATAVIDSNAIPAAEQARFYTLGAQLAYNADDYSVAAVRAKRAIELGATAENLPVLLVDAYLRGDQVDQGIAEARSMIASAAGAGRKAPESIYSLLARTLQEADRTPELLTVLIERADAYPTAANFRSAALIYLQSVPETLDADIQRSLSIDALRLMTAANAMNDRRFFVEYVSSVAEDALPNEVLVATAAGRAANLIPEGDSFFAEREQTARDNLSEDRTSLARSEANARTAGPARLATRVAGAYYAYDNFTKAEELLALALTKTEADADLINLRLGLARYRQGNAAGAIEALTLVQGLRKPLAQLWIAQVRATTPATAAVTPAAEPAPAPAPAS